MSEELFYIEDKRVNNYIIGVSSIRFDFREDMDKIHENN